MKWQNWIITSLDINLISMCIFEYFFFLLITCLINSCINFYGEPRMRDMGGGEEREQSARAFHHRLCPRKLVSLWRSSIETLLRSLKGHRSGHTVYFMKRKLLDRKPDRIMVCTVRREPREWWSVGWSTISIEHSFIWRCNK